jgi:O-antigen/teichoic acid export membrane protein
MKGLRRVINNTIVSFLGQAVIWASTLLLTIAFGRWLGAVRFGELYFAVNFVALIGVPVNSGFDRQAIRDVAQKPDKAAGYLSNLLLIRLSIWFILFILLLLASGLLGYSAEVRLLVAICGFDLLCNALASTFASLHYAFERTVFPVVGNVLEKGLSALFGILLLRSGAGVETMAVVIVVGSLINGVWQAVWFFRMVEVKFAVDLALIREILRKNVPFFLNGMLLVGYTSIDTLLLSLMTNSAVVGWYGAANRLFDTMSFIPVILISSIMFPIFSKLSMDSDAGLKLAVEKSVNFLLFCGIPIATAMIVAAPSIIRFLYQRDEFAHSIPALQALAPGLVFAYISYALSSIILSKKQDSKLPIISAIALVINLVLNLVLILLYQHIGAAIASSITEVLVFCILVFFIPRDLLPFGSLRVALKAFIASLVMAVVILLLHGSHIFFILAIAMLVYVGVSVLLGVIPREDYQAMYRAIRQKARPTSSPNTSDLPEMPQPSYDTHGLVVEELATTMKLPAIRRQSSTDGLAENPQSPHAAVALLEDGLNASYQKLPKEYSCCCPVSGYRDIPSRRFRKFKLEAFSNNNGAYGNSITINVANPTDTVKDR